MNYWLPIGAFAAIGRFNFLVPEEYSSAPKRPFFGCAFVAAACIPRLCVPLSMNTVGSNVILRCAPKHCCSSWRRLIGLVRTYL